MSINITSIHKALGDWLSNLTGETVIIANPSKGRPDGNYSSISILTYLPIGMNGEEKTSLPLDLVKFEYSQTYQILVSLNFFRNTSFLNASKARDSFDLISTIESLQSNGLFFISTSDIRQITDVVKKEMEDRYQFDALFYIRSTETEEIEEIKKIEVTNEIDGTTTIIT